ncbi:MAG: preprotein translocase subunit YajC [Rhodospirillaceae bacterium]|jgi:preprotein translocase subunit YajC|nr:preprotein translocase subunit YajC [Rhodospirillaceae bacterium]MBT7955393.1 preprotein translocase subunit YajC [Rhodospirillaceae bacterium]
MFISPAYAQGAGGADGGFATLLPLVLIFVVFYFLLIRPQQKRAKQHREMLGAVRRGDKVVTGGGIMGTVTKVVNDDELAVEIAEGIKIRVQRSLLASVQSKSQPASGDAAPAPANDEGGGGPMGMIGKLLGGGKK